MFKASKYLLVLLFLLAASRASFGQRGEYDTIRLGSIIVPPDTFPMVYMHDFVKAAAMPLRIVKKRAEYNKLRYNIYKVYPYAVMAAEVLKDVDSNLLAIGDNKKKRKAYLKTVEQELNDRFKGEVQDLTISQGHVLVKLIDRQAGKSCYHILKELKGGFSASIVNSVARLFSHNLRKEYDPTGEDYEMEQIVRELEDNYFYRYEKYTKARAKLQAKPKAK